MCLRICSHSKVRPKVPYDVLTDELVGSLIHSSSLHPSFLLLALLGMFVSALMPVPSIFLEEGSLFKNSPELLLKSCENTEQYSGNTRSRMAVALVLKNSRFGYKGCPEASESL